MKKSSAKQRFAERGGASVKSEIFLGKIEADSFAPTPSRKRKKKRQAIMLAVLTVALRRRYGGEGGIRKERSDGIASIASVTYFGLPPSEQL